MKFELQESAGILAFINPVLGKDIKKEDLSVEAYNAKVEELVAKLANSTFTSRKDKDGRWVLGFM